MESQAVILQEACTVCNDSPGDSMTWRVPRLAGERKKIFGLLEVIIGQSRHLSPAPGPFQNACLNQIAFINIFEGTLILLHCGGERFDADRASAVLLYDGEENFAIHFVKTGAIDTKPG